MKTPIKDFIKKYSESDISRFHMPGHKGRAFIGPESHDLTEIKGADDLGFPEGIIAESEKYCAELFGAAKTAYSTEGATLAIRAMLFLVTSGNGDTRPLVLAGRNAHKSFLYSGALLDFDVDWIYPSGDYTALASARVTREDVEAAINKTDRVPTCVYLTSPDYLGNISDVKEISDYLREKGIPLLVDNAHGAYLKFQNPSRHPIDLGAFMCCDSAHKTLPVLTGGAYLHLSKSAYDIYGERVKSAMSLFASTSPSYLILESLDACNGYLSDGYGKRLEETVKIICDVKNELRGYGLKVLDSEPLKIVVDTSDYGYSGEEIAELLRSFSVEPEYTDPDHLVLMCTPENTVEDYSRLLCAFRLLKRKTPSTKIDLSPLKSPVRKKTLREAVFSTSVRIKADLDSVGRIVAFPLSSCPPAIPIVTSGEIIRAEYIPIFEKYGVDQIDVINE